MALEGLCVLLPCDAYLCQFNKRPSPKDKNPVMRPQQHYYGLALHRASCKSNDFFSLPHASTSKSVLLRRTSQLMSRAAQDRP